MWVSAAAVPGLYQVMRSLLMYTKTLQGQGLKRNYYVDNLGMCRVYK